MPQRHIEDGYRLGQWVTVQRTKYKNGKLSPERIQTLEAVKGWVWNTHEAAWQEGFEHLQRFVKREGQARVPTSYMDDGFKLGRWANYQRAAYKGQHRKKLTPERIQTLEAFEGWVWVAR